MTVSGGKACLWERDLSPGEGRARQLEIYQPSSSQHPEDSCSKGFPSAQKRKLFFLQFGDRGKLPVMSSFHSPAS